MAIFADKEAVGQLQQFFDCLGEFGGVIQTNVRAYWDLELKVYEADEKSKLVSIGVFDTSYGIVFFDPKFALRLTMDRGRITSAELQAYLSASILSTIRIDIDDIAHIHGGFHDGYSGKDEPGMRERFSSFMNNMASGPYLREPKSVERHNHIFPIGELA